MSDNLDDIKEQILIPPGSIIDKNIYLFLYTLIRKIFLIPESEESKKKVEGSIIKWIKDINDKIIKNKNKFISIKYDIKNFRNILSFIKGQNKKYAADILEGILILIFSYAFQTEKTNTFGEYLFNENGKIKLEDSENFDLVTWFKPKAFIPSELNNLKELLTKDNSMENDKEKTLAKNSPLYYILLEIQKLKLSNIKNINKNNNIDKYIYRNTFLSQKLTDNDFSNIYFQKKLIRLFFISVFIYYQNKHSPLMKYIKEKKYKKEEEEEEVFLSGIPFDYNLNEAVLDNRLSNSIFSPSKIEPRITQMTMTKNKMERQGLFELAKALIFNKNIKICYLDSTLIRSNYLDFFNLGLGVYDNYNLEELNLSYNNLNKDSEKYLSKIIYHLKQLKTINFTNNDLKTGVASFFIMLKKLYREGKTKLENLVLNKCNLDSSSWYELCELLKSKFCKLKRLYLSNNIFPTNINFLKKLKKNKILTEIYFNKANFGNNYTDDIMRLISNTHIESLYLYKNKLTNFNDCIRILYRTKLMKDKNSKNENNNSKEEENIFKDDSFLINLDLSDNSFRNKNEEHIKLIKNIVKDTTLYCIDLSHILLGITPEKYKDTQEKSDYKKEVSDLEEQLNKDTKKYDDIIDEIKDAKYDKIEQQGYIKNFKEKLEEKLEEKEINYLKGKINDDILKNENAKYSLFLKEKAFEIVNDIFNTNENNGDEFKISISEKLKEKNSKGKEEKKEDEKQKSENVSNKEKEDEDEEGEDDESDYDEQEDNNSNNKVDNKDNNKVTFNKILFKNIQNYLYYNMSLGVTEIDIEKTKKEKINKKLIII